MAQVRVVVREELVSQAENACKTLGLKTLTDLVNVLISRYSTHLVDTWEFQANVSNLGPSYTEHPETPTPLRPQKSAPPGAITFNR